MKSLLRLILVSVAIVVGSHVGYGQVSSSSSLSGVVADPSGAVVAGASVAVKNNDTTAEFKATTASNGTFTVPALNAGTYTVTVSAPGFKQALVKDVKLDAGTPASIRISLEVGATTDTVTIQGGAEIVQTQSATISTTLVGRQLTDLPMASRDTLHLLATLPGATTTGTPRSTTFNGLGRNTINITIDGLNTQDNFGKSTDGFFSYINPRVDAIEEVSVSTATPGAESSGQGAVQIKMVTRQGNNDFHGSGYWYHRNSALNTNYWFNNRDIAPYNVQTAKTCVDGVTTPITNPAAQELYNPNNCHSPRAKLILNQNGFRIGGPITLPKKIFGPLGFDGRDKAFFFVNYEEYRLPNEISRQRTILSPSAQQGLFRYNSSTGVREVNLLTLAANNGHISTTDPVVRQLLVDIRNSTTSTGGITQLADPNLQQFTFINSAMDNQYYPTIRLDFNLTSRHHLENTYNYQNFNTSNDILNSVDNAFPGFPNFGTQLSNRFANSTALRSTLSPTLVNEARFGFNGGTVLFRPNLSTEMFTGPLANQAGFNLGISAAGISNATSTTGGSRRNAPVLSFSDTITWTRGSHSWSFGAAFTQVNLFMQSQTVVPAITFGVDTTDPANSIFNTTNLQGASNTDLANARNLYATLVGRVTAITGNAVLDEETGRYSYLGNNTQRGRMREWGFFAQDAWRVRQNLTLNYGLRYELQLPFSPLNSSYSTATLADLFGVSGPGNIFKPGTLTGRETQFIQYKEGVKAYNIDYKNFGPSFGFAWSPGAKDGWLKRVLGESGQTVVRGGYSISYNREGMAQFTGVFDGNPGATVTATRNITLGNLGTLPVLLRETNRLGPGAFPTAPAYPILGAITNSVDIFDPDLKVPYVQSWSFGIQREINKDMAIEVRYVGNRQLRGWTAYNMNELNIVENGVLNEFKLAQANLQANNAAGGARAGSFAYFGAGTGTVPLPIALAYFTGQPASQAGNAALYPNNSTSLFRSATFVNPLAVNNPNPGGFAGALDDDLLRRTQALNAGLPANFLLANPGLANAQFTGNGGYTRYDSAVVEFRRRLAKGLLMQGSYVFAKGFSSQRTSLRIDRTNALPTGTNSVLRHTFKANWVYEMPFGKGKMFFDSASGVFDKVLGGWEFHGTARVQSGSTVNLGNVGLVGMTQKDLQEAFVLRFDDTGKQVYGLPDDIILNTRRAFGVSATTASGYGTLGVPTGRYIAPANSATCVQVVSGQCASQNVFLYANPFTRFDLGLVKKTKISERFNVEFRTEFLNAFNHINFTQSGMNTTFTSANFGRVTAAFRDTANSDDPGGRLIQLVLRLNF